MNSVLKDTMGEMCPHCQCCNPKVKKNGLFKYFVHPLSSTKLAKNHMKNIYLKCVFSLS